MTEDLKNTKKQVPLRLSPKLYAAIAAWAEDDFRSVNGQIEYLLRGDRRADRAGHRIDGTKKSRPVSSRPGRPFFAEVV